MENYFYSNDTLDDVKRLKDTTKQFNSKMVGWRKTLEEKATRNDYKLWLRCILDKANKTYGHPKRKRDDVTIIDPQYSLFLKGFNKHAIAYAAEGDDESGVPVYIRYEARPRKTEHCVERLDSQHVGRAQRVEKDKLKFVDRDDHNKNEFLYWEPDQSINRPTQNQNAGVNQDRLFNSKNRNVGVDNDLVFNRPTLNPDVGDGQDHRIHLPTQNPNVGVDQDRRINRLTQNQNAVIDQNQIFNRLTRNRNVGVGQERLIIRPTLNRNSGVCHDQIVNHSAQNRNVGVDQDRIINCLTQNRNVGVNQNRETTRLTQYQNVDVDQDQIIKQYMGVDHDRRVTRSSRNRNVGVNQDRVITRPAKFQTVDVYQDRPTQNQNVGVDQDRKTNRPTQKRNVGDLPVAKNNSSRLRKVKCKEKVYEYKETKPTVRVNSENLGRKRGRGNNQVKVDCCKRANQVQKIKKEKVQGDNGLKTDLKDRAAKDRLVRKVKARSSRKRAYYDADVEILDYGFFHKKPSPFVLSKPFQNWIEVGDVDCHYFGGSSSAADEFRKKLEDVLKKPFDRDELKMSGDYVRRLYYDHFPDVRSKLSRCQYNKGKRLNILRGFLFWLEYVSQQGSFKPWKDGRCLAVKPGPPKNSNRVKQSKRKILK